MSLISRASLLATRIATEFKSVRTALLAKANLSGGFIVDSELPNRLQAYSEVAAWPDANDATTSGFHCVYGSHTPTADVYFIYVDAISSDSIMQLAVLDATPQRIFSRRYNGTWGAWGELATTAGVATGYQPLSATLSALAILTTTSFGRGLLLQNNGAELRNYASLQEATTALGLLAGFTPSADQVPYFTGPSGGSLMTVTAFARTLLDDANAAAFLTTLGAQPVDSDLTAIAALTTTAYGRAFLALADQTALMGLVAQATSSVQGKIEIATLAEAAAGTDTVRAVTPAGMENHWSTKMASFAIDQGSITGPSVLLYDYIDNADDFLVTLEALTQYRSVRAVSTTNIANLAATGAIDGVTHVGGDLILLTGQTTASQNGLYMSTGSGNISRAGLDMLVTARYIAALGVVSVREGTTYGGTKWVTDFKGSDTVGTTAMNWTKIAAGTDTGWQQPIAYNSGTSSTTTQFMWGPGFGAWPAGNELPVFRKVGSKVYVRGLFQRTSGAGVGAFFLPVNARVPANRLVWRTIIVNGTTFGSCYCDNLGNVAIYTAFATGNFLIFDIEYDLEQP